VRLIAPKFVTPYRMSGARGKNDAADAAAICEVRCLMKSDATTLAYGGRYRT
jgi:transposase